MILSLAEIRTMIEGAEIYMDPDHPEYIEKKKIEDLLPPFLEYDADPVHVYADGKVFLTMHRLTIRLYTDRKEDESVGKMRKILNNNSIKYREECELWDPQMIWLTTFTMEA